VEMEAVVASSCQVLVLAISRCEANRAGNNHDEARQVLQCSHDVTGIWFRRAQYCSTGLIG